MTTLAPGFPGRTDGGDAAAIAKEPDPVERLLSAVQAAGRGDLRGALDSVRAAFADRSDASGVARLAAALHQLLSAWQNSVREKEQLLGQLQLSQAEVEEINEKLREEVDERRRTEKQLASLQAELVRTARAAGMSEVATDVLHNVGNVLNSINVASLTLREHLMASRAERAVLASTMLMDHQREILTEDPRGVQVSALLRALAQHQVDLNRELAREADTLCSFVSHVSTIIASYQSYGRVLTVLERVAVIEVVDSAAVTLGTSFEHDRTRFELSAGDNPVIISDRNKLHHIILTLLTNARDAVRDVGGERLVQVTVQSTARGARIDVRDTGVGISRDDLSRIFVHGFSTKPGGHGFSLHSSANAARALGGSLEASSEGPGLGATFVLHLPSRISQSSQLERGEDT
jgi:signal transduction histidine kinase